MERFASAVSELAATIAGVLAGNLGHRGKLPTESCSKASCFLRLNRYPRCPFSQEAFGLVPHTDSDFITVLHQDQVGGLQLMKDSNWVAVRPNPDALIVNIGDLFQVSPAARQRSTRLRSLFFHSHSWLPRRFVQVPPLTSGPPHMERPDTKWTDTMNTICTQSPATVL